jgi:hypothetical protein
MGDGRRVYRDSFFFLSTFYLGALVVRRLCAFQKVIYESF